MRSLLGRLAVCFRGPRYFRYPRSWLAWLSEKWPMPCFSQVSGSNLPNFARAVLAFATLIWKKRSGEFCADSFLTQRPLICGRTIHRGYGNIIQPQIDSELRAMMDGVVQDKIAQHRNSRHRENGLAAHLQRPWLQQMFVIGSCESGSGGANVLVIVLEHLRSNRRDSWLRRRFPRRCEIELIERDRLHGPVGDFRKVLCETSQCHGLLMWSPVELVRNAFKGLSRRRHFHVEFLQQTLGDDVHGCFSCGLRNQNDLSKRSRSQDGLVSPSCVA